MLIPASSAASAVLPSAELLPFPFHCFWSSRGGKLVPPSPCFTGGVLPGESQLQVPPIPLQIAHGGMNPSSMYCIPVPPNCSLGSGQGGNGPCLPRLPCSGCRRLAHELAVNQNARGRQFSASETCPHQALGEGGEPRVSKRDGRAPERDLISFPIIFSSCINFPYLKQILPENAFCVSGPVKTPPVTTCACPLLAASAKSQQFYVLLY